MSDNYPPGQPNDPSDWSGANPQPPQQPSQPPQVPGGESAAAPPPPPPPYGAPNTPATQQANVGAAISWATSKFGPNASVLVIFALIPAAVALFQNLMSTGVSRALNSTEVLTGGDIGLLFGSVLLAIAGFALSLLAMIGLINASLKITRGEKPELSDIWHPGRAVTFVLVSLVMGLSIAFGLFFLCFIPGLILWWAWQFAQYSALDTDKSVVDCLKESWELVMANKLPALLMLIAVFVASLITALPVVGVLLSLVVLPIVTLTYAHLYRQFRGEAVAA